MRLEKLSQILNSLTTQKSKEYGPASVAMLKIADVWSALLGIKIRPHQVALLYAAAKLVRANHNYKQDNYLDLICYANIADEIHKEDSSNFDEELTKNLWTK